MRSKISIYLINCNIGILDVCQLRVNLIGEIYISIGRIDVNMDQ